MSDLTALAETILDSELRHPNFFNGRLLTRADFEAEQAALHAHLRHLGLAVGSGVAQGLEISLPPDADKRKPVLRITEGVAVNRSGRTLRLPADMNLALNPPKLEAAAACVFANCEKKTGSVLESGPGFFVLTIGPASAFSKERLEVSGTGTGAVTCDWRDVVEGVQFRLVRLKFKKTDPATDPPRARNLLTIACLGLPDLASAAWPLPTEYGWETLMPDEFSPEHEVPLAVLEWTGTALAMLKSWPVRRRLARPGAAGACDYFTGDRRASEGEALFLDFQDDLAEFIKEKDAATPPAPAIAAHDHFVLLPPAGVLPAGFAWEKFLGALAPPEVTPTDTALLPRRLRDSFTEEPVSVPKLEAGEVNSGKLTLAALKVHKVPERAELFFARSHLGRIRLFPPKDETTNFTAAALFLADGSFRGLLTPQKKTEWPLIFDDVPGGEAQIWLTEVALGTQTNYSLQLQELRHQIPKAEADFVTAKEAEAAALDQVGNAVRQAQACGPANATQLAGGLSGGVTNALSAALMATLEAQTRFTLAENARVNLENVKAAYATLKARNLRKVSRRQLTQVNFQTITAEAVARLIAALRFTPILRIPVINGRVTDRILPANQPKVTFEDDATPIEEK